jgi:hypothetical protein
MSSSTLKLIETLDGAACDLYRILKDPSKIPGYPQQGRMVDLIYFAALDLFKRAEEVAGVLPSLEKKIRARRISMTKYRNDLCAIYMDPEVCDLDT